MARPTFPNIADSAVALDAFGEDDLFEDLRDAQEALRIEGVAVNIAEITTASASYVTLATVKVEVRNLADYTGIQRKLYGDIDVKTTAGTATFRLQDAATATNGTEVTTTSASYEDKQPTLDLAAGWIGTIRTINVQGKTTSGTASLEAPTRQSWTVEF